MTNGLTLGLVVGLCVTVILAVIGWTISISQAVRMRAYQKLEKDQTVLATIVSANATRLGVLESRYDAINVALIEIKLMLQKHLGV